MAKGTVNKVILLGRLGNEPEVRTTQNGTTVATLSMATNNGMGDTITTEWHRVVIFGKSAEAIQKYANKGTQIFIEGRLRTNKWQDKNGNMQYTTEVIANNFQFINGNNSSQTNTNNQNINNNLTNNSSNQNQNATKQDNIPNFNEINSSDLDDDIPF